MSPLVLALSDIVQVIDKRLRGYFGLQGAITELHGKDELLPIKVSFGKLGSVSVNPNQLKLIARKGTDLVTFMVDSDSVPPTSPRTEQKKMKSYIITPSGAVYSYTSGRAATAALAANEGSVQVVKPEDLANVPTPVMLKLYNTAAAKGEGKPIKKFASRTDADKRVTMDVVEYLAEPGAVVEAPAPSAETVAAGTGKVAPSNGSTSKAAASEKTPKAKAKGGAAKKSPSATAEPRGRISQYTGKKIFKLVAENPRREGTIAGQSFNLIKNGMKYEDFIAAGGRRKDLAWDEAHKYVEVR